ncbi:carbohydrate kinase [Desemzia sp. RIT804]|nr:carbohydrate kinase [Desemzia sp. RIT 804]
MGHIYCIGEALIDFVCTDSLGLFHGKQFEKNAGGAPANVAAAIAKLGGETSFLGQIGKDDFGDHLKVTLENHGVQTQGMIQKGTTTLAFVGIDQAGERSFSFVRGADSNYDSANLPLSDLDQTDIVHFGAALGFSGGALEESYFRLREEAAAKGAFISFDPNYRDTLIAPHELAGYLEKVRSFIAVADFVKLSDEELTLITGETDVSKGAQKICALGAKYVAVTLGKAGTYLQDSKAHQVVRSIAINQVDSTGAGDAFTGGLLYQLQKAGTAELSFSKLLGFLEVANAVGALTCTKYGAIPALPSLEEVESVLAN